VQLGCGDHALTRLGDELIQSRQFGRYAVVSLQRLPSNHSCVQRNSLTQVLRYRLVWQRLSLAGALANEPDGSDAQLIFQLRPGAYNDVALIEFLTELNEQQRTVLLI
jgi:hypothetical protein